MRALGVYPPETTHQQMAFLNPEHTSLSPSPQLTSPTQQQKESLQALEAARDVEAMKVLHTFE